SASSNPTVSRGQARAVIRFAAVRPTTARLQPAAGSLAATIPTSPASPCQPTATKSPNVAGLALRAVPARALSIRLVPAHGLVAKSCEGAVGQPRRRIELTECR